VLTTAFRVLARCWPALLAWFLAGWTARALIIHGAGYLLNINEDIGLVLLPVAILALLAAYVGMFLSIRRELPHLGRVDDVEPGEVKPTPARQWSDTLLSAILPFFLLYVAWNLIRDDVIDLYFSSTTQDNFFDDPVSDGSTFVASIVLVVVAFVGRWLLSRFSARLPRWTAALATYFEAVWVLVALFIVRDLLAPVPHWFATRRMFAWAVDAWAGIRADFAWLGALGDAIGWAVAQFGTLVALPLAWLAFASIIYFGVMPRSSRPGPASVRAASERWERLPVWMRRLGTAVSAGFLDRWRPVVLAARLIWRSGPVALGTYLLGFAVLTAGAEWLRYLTYRLIGPHDINWWYGASDGVEWAIDTVMTVLQVALVAAAFDHALRSDEAEKLVDEAGDAISAAAAPAGEPRSS
jgi:hypothetical protein